MLKEALEFLADLTARAMIPQDLPGNATTVRKLVNGEVKEFNAEVGPREHKPATLTDLIALANRFVPQTEGDGPDEEDFLGNPYHPVVWYDTSYVVAVLDDTGHRFEMATLALTHSDLFVRVLDLRRTKSWMNQKDFIRLLRVELAGTMAPAVLLDRVRKLRFESGQVVRSEVTKKAESMGRDINSQVSGEGEFPDEVELELPVYKTPGESGWRFVLRCAVEVDPTRTEAFRLTPLPDEIERVTDLAVASLAERLRAGLAEGVPCYQGKP